MSDLLNLNEQSFNMGNFASFDLPVMYDFSDPDLEERIARLNGLKCYFEIVSEFSLSLFDEMDDFGTKIKSRNFKLPGEASGFENEYADSIFDTFYTYRTHLDELRCSSIVATMVSVLESTLHYLASKMAKERGIELPGNKGTSPTLNYYLRFLTQECGFKNLNRSEMDELYAIRKIRNDYVHSLGSDLQEATQELLKKVAAGNEQGTIDDDFVEHCFSSIGSIVTQLCSDYCDKTGHSMWATDFSGQTDD